MAGGRGKKKEKENATKTRTPPRKQKTLTDEEEEGRPRHGYELAEGDRAVTGTGEELEEKTQLSSPFTQEQDEQIAAFFEEHKFYYGMADADYKNKKKRKHLLLEFAQSMFTSSKCIFSFKFFS